MEDIDIVIPWVDGADPAWRAELGEYAGQGTGGDASEERFRDWDNLCYLFRGIDTFAPWVRKVFFITWGHLPPWMNTGCDRLVVVNHRDYIPHEYLPTFSSHTIELNIHRIEGLSERFIYFNDDMFLGREVPPERFFRRGLPCDMARLGIIPPSNIDHIVLNNVKVINRRYDKKKVIRKNRSKWYNARYGVGENMKTLSMAPWSTFPGFKDTHMPQPYLRATFERMWKQEADVLDATCRNRVRQLSDVNQWLMRYDQLARGEFAPVSEKDTHLDLLPDGGIEHIASYIREQKYAMFCLNDSSKIVDFEGVKTKLNAAFESILKEKSRYEA